MAPAETITTHAKRTKATLAGVSVAKHFHGAPRLYRPQFHWPHATKSDTPAKIHNPWGACATLQH